MLRLVVILYMALSVGANPALAGPVAESLRDGDMRKLVFSDPKALPEAVLLDASAQPHEMPSLDRLQTAMPEIAVLPVATGRNSVAGIQKFYAEAGVSNLPILLDDKSALARGMGVMGLPVTVILNPQGQEVARLIGDAEWDSASAQAVLAALLAGQ
jgi:hypothetical protein